MPDRIEPYLTLLKTKPPKGPEWAYEVKWDGYRLAVHMHAGKVKIITRGGHDWTDRFPFIEQAARALPVATAILDGEAVVLDEHGKSDFGALQRSPGGRGGRKASDEAILYAFDALPPRSDANRIACASSSIAKSDQSHRLYYSALWRYCRRR